jgi:translation initiation factor 3 subunit M
MSVSVFIDASMEQQSEELRSYLKGLGAEISEELSPKGTEDDLAKIIAVCDQVFSKESSEHDMEGVLNSIVSMLIMVPADRAENLILAFCEKMVNVPSNRFGHLNLRVLNLLFNGLQKDYAARYHVYFYLIRAAMHTGDDSHICLFFKDVPSLKEQFAAAPPTNDQMQKLYRLLHEGLVKANKSELASKVMVELLGTYSAETAAQAREDAKKCIVASLADPNAFLLDHLLALKPVKFLEGDLIHDLLLIFVREKLSSYLAFYKQHKEFISSVGLDHETLVKKIRLLTFMGMAGEQPQMSFEAIRKELQLAQSDEAVEEFIIEVLKTKLVRGRMDQRSKKVMINNTVQRTFGLEQWRQLHAILLNWNESIHRVSNNLKNLDELIPQMA